MIDPGPEGRDQGGGKLVVAGTPEAVAEHPTSGMGRSLSRDWSGMCQRAWRAEGGAKGLGEGARVAWVVAWRSLQNNVRSELLRLCRLRHIRYTIGIISLLTVRIISNLLNPAAFLLLGASAVFGSSAANALTFNWNFSTTNGNPVNTGTTSGTITGLVEGNNNVDNNNSLLIATLTSSTSGNLSVPQTWSQANGGLAGGFITVTSGNISDYNFNFNNQIAQFRGIKEVGVNENSFVNEPNVGTDRTTTGLRDPITFTSATTVPGPLPILGIPAVLLYSRNLKKRIKARREALGASLT